MELLYIWMDERKNCLLDGVELNFSPEYNFYVKEINNEIHFYRDNQWKGKKSIFHIGNIENVTAIVGKNGAGKTTILKALMDLDCRNYSGSNKSIMVFRENQDITIYYNVSNFVNETEFSEISVNNQEIYREILTGNKLFRDILKVYVTNGSFGNGSGISSFQKLDAVALSPADINTISSSYFRKLYNWDKGFFHLDEKYIITDWIFSKRNSAYFQSLCDVIFLNKILSGSSPDDYHGKISQEFLISFIPLNVEIDENIHYRSQELELIQGVIQKQKVVKEILSHLTFSDVWIKYCYLNLLVEILIQDSSILEKLQSCSNLRDVKEVISTIENENNYFINALSEVEKLSELLSSGIEPVNTFPEGDLANKHDITFSYIGNVDAYKNMVSFISQCYYSPNSFVMKYIQISFIGMSSGERAFQNIFSWLNLIPEFDIIQTGIARELKGTMLILMDELDLYLHPEWQRIFLKYFIEEINKQFPECTVQIVIATHSPLCLSDIPCENTIYLKSIQDNRINIDRRDAHVQTFGRDVFTILNDAFYLEKGTMGAYAEAYINQLINDISNFEESGISIEDSLKCIEYVGDPILKRGLQRLIKKKDNNFKLELLKKERDIIEAQIARLEARNNG